MDISGWFGRCVFIGTAFGIRHMVQDRDSPIAGVIDQPLSRLHGQLRLKICGEHELSLARHHWVE